MMISSPGDPPRGYRDDSTESGGGGGHPRRGTRRGGREPGLAAGARRGRIDGDWANRGRGRGGAPGNLGWPPSPSIITSKIGSLVDVQTSNDPSSATSTLLKGHPTFSFLHQFLDGCPVPRMLRFALKMIPKFCIATSFGQKLRVEADIH
jgi:hypothetical protein